MKSGVGRAGVDLAGRRPGLGTVRWATEQEEKTEAKAEDGKEEVWAQRSVTALSFLFLSFRYMFRFSVLLIRCVDVVDRFWCSQSAVQIIFVRYFHTFFVVASFPFFSFLLSSFFLVLLVLLILLFLSS